MLSAFLKIGIGKKYGETRFTGQSQNHGILLILVTAGCIWAVEYVRGTPEAFDVFSVVILMRKVGRHRF